MRFLRTCLAAAVSTLAMGQAFAEEEFVPEKITVEERIKPGPNVFTVDQSWTGASRINVVGAGELDRKGNLSVGLVTQFVLTKTRRPPTPPRPMPSASPMARLKPCCRNSTSTRCR